MTPDADQIHYLRTVLGIESILVPEQFRDESPDKSPDESPDVLVRGNFSLAQLVALIPLDRDTFPLGAELTALVERMIKAMKLEMDRVLIIQWKNQLPDELQSALEKVAVPTVVFGIHNAAKIIDAPPELGRWHVLAGRKVMVTFAPYELIESVENKRIAWTHLQDVMKEL